MQKSIICYLILCCFSILLSNFFEDFTAKFPAGNNYVWEENRGWERWNGPLDGERERFRTDNAQWTAGFDAWCIRAPFGNDHAHIYGQAAQVILMGEEHKRWLISPSFLINSLVNSIQLSFDLAMTNNIQTNSVTPHITDVFAVLILTGAMSGGDVNYQVVKKWDSSGDDGTYNIRDISHEGKKITIDLDAKRYDRNIWIAFYAGRYADAGPSVWFFIDNFSIEASTGSEEPPRASLISHVYPNPIRSGEEGIIDVYVKENSFADLKIFNIRGQLVKTFDRVNSGFNSFRWDGRDNFGNVVSSGIYFYRITGPDIDETRRVAIIK